MKNTYGRGRGKLTTRSRTATTNSNSKKKDGQNERKSGLVVAQSFKAGNATKNEQNINDDIDTDITLQRMIHSICQNAFDTNVAGNGIDQNRHLSRIQRRSDDPKDRDKKENEKGLFLSLNQNRNPSFSKRNNTISSSSSSLVPPSEWFEKMVNMKDSKEIMDRNEDKRNSKTDPEFRKHELLKDIQQDINHHLKSLQQTEDEMRTKFSTAKKKLHDCIVVLELHHEELCKKEVQYFHDLNECRKVIFSEAQDHFHAEIKKLENI